jgi:hypothetical protein
VDLGSKLIGLTDNVGHTSLVSHKGSEVARLASIISRE